MFDSHLHGNFGALIASTTFENTENFLKAVKEMISQLKNAYHLLKICSVCLIFFLLNSSVKKENHEIYEVIEKSNQTRLYFVQRTRT